MRLPHKEPLLFAKKVIESDYDSALVEIEFGSLPTLAMNMEAAAQAFSFIDRKQEGSWGVVAMIKDVILHQKALDTSCLCEVSIIQSIDAFYKVAFRTFTKNTGTISSGELSIKIF